jgi:hypothetical protein
MAITKKLKQAISIISEMDESRLDALLLLLRQPVEDFELSEEDKQIVQERITAYKTGKDKGVPALSASRRIKAKLKKNKNDFFSSSF